MTRHLDRPLLAALGLSLILAPAALAQTINPVGTMTATIDGAPYEGETLDVPSEGTSTAEARAIGPITSLTVQAHDVGAKGRMENVLSVEVTLMGDGSAPSIVDASASFWPKGMGAPFYLSEDSGRPVEVTFDNLSLEDGAASVTGGFSARLCRKENFTAETDTSDCKEVEGRFDTPLRKVE